MKLYLDPVLAILSLTAGSTTAISQIKVKRGDDVPLEIVGDIPCGATGVFAAKSTLAGDPVLTCPTWSAPVTDGGGYLFALSLNTTELNALFTGGVTLVTLLAEITWTVGGRIRSTQTFNLVVDDDVWRGDEGTPTPALAQASFLLSSPDGSQWRVSITNDGQISQTKI